MNAFDERPARRVGAASVSHGSARRLGVPMGEGAPTVQELDHQLGFDLGYRDGLARATADAETRAIEARTAWEAEARLQQDEALAALDHARVACLAAASAMGEACEDERAWATGVAVEIAYAAVVRLIGQRHAMRDLMGPLCEAALREVVERPLHLRVAPSDVESVSPYVTGASIAADERLSPGACELDTPRGRVVAGIAERLTLLRDTLLAGLVESEGRASP